MVGGEGIEPSRPCGHRILSPACIPIPPPALQTRYGKHLKCCSSQCFHHPPVLQAYFSKLVDPTRLELVTFSMSRKRSNQLSYGSGATNLEARVGIEPTYRGFADPCLTTWLSRHRSHQQENLRCSLSIGKPVVFFLTVSLWCSSFQDSRSPFP